MTRITESDIESLAIQLLERQGYKYLHAPDIAPDSATPERASFEQVLLVGRLDKAVRRINPAIPDDVRVEAIKEIQRIASPELLANNETFHRYLTEGVPVSRQVKGYERGDRVWLIDFESPLNNDFLVVNQFTVIENGENKRLDIVLFINEAHRTQYGFRAKTIDDKDAFGNIVGKRVVYGFAKYMRDALPNAIYLGFTGTPIENTDVNTPAAFGNYVDVYDIAQAVEDGATVRIFYESRLAKVNLSEEGKRLVDELDEELDLEDLNATQKAKAKWTQLEALGCLRTHSGIGRRQETIYQRSNRIKQSLCHSRSTRTGDGCQR